MRDWLSDPDNRALLHLREQLSRQARLWKRTGCNREYLFGEAGCAAAQRFADAFPDELEPLEREFLHQNGAYLAFVRRRNRMVRAFGVLLVLLLVTASTAAWIAQRKSENARLAMHQVQLKEADLQSRGGNTPQAVDKALAAGADLPGEAVRTLSDAFSRNRLMAMIAARSPSLDRPVRPAFNATGDRVVTLQTGQGARQWRLSDGRFIPADPPVLSDGRLGIHSLVMALATDEVFGIAADGVYRLPAFAGSTPDYPCGAQAGAALALDAGRQRLALAVPGDGGHQGVCVLDLTEPGRMLFAHSFAEQELRGLSFSADGRFLLTASSIGRTHLIDLDAPKGEQPIRLSLPPEGPVGRPFNRAVFDPAGERIGIAAADEQVRLFDRDGRLIAALGSAIIDAQRVQIHNSAVRDLAFSPDGAYLVAVDDEGQVVRWSLTKSPQAVVLGQHELSIVSVAVGDPMSGRALGTDAAGEAKRVLVLTASLDGTARLWTLATGKPLAVFGHDEAVSWADFVADSERVLSFSVRDGSLRLWSVLPRSRLAFELKHPDPTNHVWHLDMTSVPRELLGSSGPDTAAAEKSPLWLATAGYDGEVRVWRYERDGQPPRLSYSFAQQDAAAAEGTDTDIRPVRRVRFSPSGRLLAAARSDGSARLHDLLTGRSCRLQVASSGATAAKNSAADQVFDVRFAPDESWLLAASDNPNQPLRLFDVLSCEPVTGIGALEQSTVATEAIAVRQVGDVTLVATGDRAGRVRLLRADGTADWQEQCAVDAKVGSISDVAIAPDGAALAIAGEAKQLAILRLNGTECGQLDLAEGHSDRLYSVAFSPEGDRILTASLDKTARLWTRTGQPLAVLVGHQDRIYHAAFSPGGGRWLLTASRDGTLRLWRAPPADYRPERAEVQSDFLPLPANAGGAAFATFSPDGHYVAGAYWDNAALLWRLWREDPLPDDKLAAQWGPDRARLALLKEAYRFRRDNAVSAAEVELSAQSRATQ
jgi:WD40 repeat protein